MNEIFFNLNSQRILFPFAFVFFVLFLTGCEKPEGDFDAKPAKAVPLATFEGGSLIDGQYIIKFKNNAITSDEMSRLAGGSIDHSNMAARMDAKVKFDIVFEEKVTEVLAKHKISWTQVKKTISLKSMQAAVVEMDQSMLEAVLNDPLVEYVEQDKLFSMSFVDPLGRSPMIPSSDHFNNINNVDYGVARVGGSVNMSNSAAHAWIIDTGIDLDHPDLNVDLSLSKNFVTGEGILNPLGDDIYGHGTHVAGIVGALDDNVGITGVAAGINLVSVKVINDFGEGSLSDLIDGLSWVVANGAPGDVANLSLGGSVSTAIDDAVKAVAQAGIIVVIAAGNDAGNASLLSPARVDDLSVYTISAIDKDDKFCLFSNYGGGVDYAAPGENILSTFPNGLYCMASGTSMAAPHAAGVFLVTNNPTYNGRATNDPDGATGDPIIRH